MASLLDIAPVMPARLSVRGAEIEVYGVGLGKIAALVGRFPALKSLLSGNDVGVDDLLGLGPQIVDAIVAAGCRVPADAVPGLCLSLSEQAEILQAVVKATLPDGVGPFVAKLQSLGLSGGLSAAPASEPKT